MFVGCLRKANCTQLEPDRHLLHKSAGSWNGTGQKNVMAYIFFVISKELALERVKGETDQDGFQPDIL